MFQHIAEFFSKLHIVIFKRDQIPFVDPFCSPRFRASVSETRQSAAFAFGVPHDINGFHPYTDSSSDPYIIQALQYCSPFHG